MIILLTFNSIKAIEKIVELVQIIPSFTSYTTSLNPGGKGMEGILSHDIFQNVFFGRVLRGMFKLGYSASLISKVLVQVMWLVIINTFI